MNFPEEGRSRSAALVSLAVGAALAGALFGCSRNANRSPPPDLVAIIGDTEGLSPGSSVQWRGINVGAVEGIAFDKAAARVDIRLHEPYRGLFREGLRARATRGFMGQGTPVLELYGGSDPDKRVLARGAQIREARWVDTLAPRAWQWAVFLITIAAFHLLVLRFLHRFAAIALTLSLLAFAAWFLCRWATHHGEEPKATKAEVALSDSAREILTEEEARKAWQSVNAELTREIIGMSAQGASAPYLAVLRAKMMEQALLLTHQGKLRAAEEIENLLRMISGDERY